jgi:hypothetical protein
MKLGFFALILTLAQLLFGCAAQNELERKVAYLDRQDGRTMRLDADQEARLCRLEAELKTMNASARSRALEDEKMIMQIYDTVEHIRKELKMAPIRSERLNDLDERLQRLEASVEIMWPKVERKRK